MNHITRIMAIKLTAGVLLLVSFSIAQDDQVRLTCQNTTCAAGETCRMIDVQCFRAPCYPVPECFPVCSPLTDCSLNCSNGYVKSYGGCDTCECKVCDPDPCPGMICFYGKAKDPDGCTLCPCHDPCMDVVCSSDTQCQVERNSTSSEYYGRCVAIVTRPPCPQVRCSTRCQFGFKHDDDGCQTCLCYDPCEGYQCPTGQHCAMTPDDCPPGAECRDGPLRYCADSNDSPLLSSSATTFRAIVETPTTKGVSTFEKPGRGESSLMQCCIGAGITDVCLPFCTTNITQLYQNYESMTGCYQYLGKFLSCVAGGRSFETCCRSRGISETCVYLCSGDDEVDMTNNHQVTQCILTSSQMVIDCFNSGVPDLDITATPSTTPSTTSSANPCLLDPETGPCDGNIERWYYSSTARACSTFRYGGCEGNGNSFVTKDACLSRCGAPGSICPDVMCGPSCQIVVDQFGCHICSCVTDCFTQGCPGNQQCTMMPGDCSNGTNCPLVPRCIPTPDFVCEALNCTLSCSNGNWMTDSRGCVICQCRQCDVIMCTETLTCPYGRAKGSDGCDTCECFQPCQGVNCAPGHCSVVREDPTGPYIGRCLGSSSTTTFAVPATERPSYCHLAPDYGLSCKQNTTRWYYDQTTSTCREFQFGGCLGNDNNFQTKDLCEAVCYREVTCRPPVCDPLPVCEYGIKTDADGCLTCQCIDPCEGVMCPGGTTCTGRRCPDSPLCRQPSQPYTHECIGATSTATTAAVRDSRGCSQIMCLMFCPAGFTQDSNGCDTCNCRDPCQNCTANQTCVTMSVDCPPTASPCPYSLVGYCVDKTVSTSTTTPSLTTSPTESTTAFRCLLCMQWCPYGMLRDARGCAVCTCYNPCQNLNCPGNASCLVTDMCPSNGACTPDVRYKGQCPTVTTAATTTQAISSRSAGPCIICLIYCMYGMEMGTNGCPVCRCKNPCQNVTCSIGERCQPVAQADAGFIGLCVVTTSVTTLPSVSVRATTAAVTGCPGPAACERLCAYNYGKYSNGCRSCQCKDPCQTTACEPSKTCVRVPSTPDCEDGHCWLTYRGVCSGGGCQMPAACDLSCPYGLALGDNGCPHCECHDPCKGFVCQDGYQCRVQNVFYCASGSNCSDIPTGHCQITYPPTSGCNVSCLYGFAKNASGQTICQCMDPCEDVVCDGAKTCIASDHGTTDENPIGYSYRGRCAVCNQTMTCRMFCRYGYAKDTDGCDICACYDPCKDVSCLARQTCVVSEQFNGKYNYVAVCTPAITPTTTTTGGLSTTTILCPMPMCLVPGGCIYGLATDARGCTTCNCAPDPCKDRQCSNPDEMCRAILYCPSNNCNPSSQAVCVDKTQPCAALQMEYARLYSGSIDQMPQLNCESNGRFKVTQCYKDVCWCVDGQTGKEATNRSNLSINCYNGNTILSETVTIDADFDVIKPEDGWKFKQQLSQQMANMLSLDESLVTVMTYGRGSIIAKMTFATDLNWTESSTEQRLNVLKPQTFDVDYDNGTYSAKFGNSFPEPSSTTGFIIIDIPGSTTNFPAESSPPPGLTVPPYDGSSEIPPSPVVSGLDANKILVIILVCVFVPIAFVAVTATVWLACKTCRDQRMIPAKPLKSGTSTEVTSLESGSEKNYSNDYKEPTTPSHDTTEA